jgi:NCAIR mutase (PurE)-related protein
MNRITIWLLGGGVEEVEYLEHKTIRGYNCYLHFHRNGYNDLDKSRFVVSEGCSGAMVAQGKTKEDVWKDAERMITDNYELMGGRIRDTFLNRKIDYFKLKLIGLC